MTMIRSFTPQAKRPGELGVHSLDHFSVSVPKMSVAEDFYAAFGLDLKADGNHLGLTTFDSPHRWGVLTEGPAKKLQYIIRSFRRRLCPDQDAGRVGRRKAARSSCGLQFEWFLVCRSRQHPD